MRLKEILLISFLSISLLGLSQTSVAFSELYKEKGKYFLKQTGELYSGKAYGKYENNQIGMSGAIDNGSFDGDWAASPAK